MDDFISYGRQTIEQDDIDAVTSALKSDFLTQGPKIPEFEKAICERTGARYCVAVSNGTAALHIAVAALGIPAGSEGITSPITFVASSNCMAYSGIKPVFADIDPVTFNIRPDEIKKKISTKTRLLIPVHFAGLAADMPAIRELAGRHHCRVIEDAAHAIGSKYMDGTPVGSCKYSDMTIFSFHPVKTITTGEGGAVTTNDPAIYEKLKLLRSHGITKEADLLSQNPGPWYYEMTELGFNYRLTDIQAALGVSQLKKLDRFIKRRNEIIRAYNNGLKNIPGIVLPLEEKEALSAYHLYVLQIDFSKFGMDRRTVMEKLAKLKIGTQVHYIPVPTQPYYKKHFGYGRGDLPNAERYFDRALSIPLYPAMSGGDVERVVRGLKEVLGII